MGVNDPGNGGSLEQVAGMNVVRGNQSGSRNIVQWFLFFVTYYLEIQLPRVKHSKKEKLKNILFAFFLDNFVYLYKVVEYIHPIIFSYPLPSPPESLLP